MFTQNKLLTAEEVAKVLDLKPSTIISWVQQRKIPFVKFGNAKSARVRFDPKLIESWIQDLSRMPEKRMERLDDQMFLLKGSGKKHDEDFDQFAKAIRETL